MLVTAVLLLLLAIFIPNVVMSGWVINEVSTDQYGNKYYQTTFIQDQFIRHETPSSIAIIDLNKLEITIVFSQYKVYWSGTTYELKERSIAAYDKQMEEMLAGVPASARKELDSIYDDIKNKMLDTTTSYTYDKNIKLVKTDDQKEILGYKSSKYNILIGNEITESFWYTDEITPYSGIDINNMVSFMSQLVPSYGSESISQSREYLDLLKSGLLLKSIEYINDSTTTEVSVSSIKQTDIVTDFFSPPSNYKEASFSDILNLMPVLEELEDDW